MTRIERLLYDCLFNNLSAWDDEEESVRDEHAALIARTRRVLDTVARATARTPKRKASTHV